LNAGRRVAMLVGAIALHATDEVMQVDGAWARCRQAHTDLTGELGVCARHEGRHFFMPHLDERDPLARADEPVDAVPR
jgi:hypothetical protein